MQELFYLNKSDRQVLLMLLTLAAIVLCALYFTGSETGAIVDDASQRCDSAGGTPGSVHYYGRDDSGGTQGSVHRYGHDDSGGTLESVHYYERFPFDPNTADSTTLLRLGLRPWQVRNIYKYRAAGGIYRKKEDFARLYGLTVKEYRELEPYIRISEDYLPASTLFAHGKKSGDSLTPSDDGGATNHVGTTLNYPVKLREGETIDLNLSDTSALKAIPGIGSYYARRIIDYGQRLGGYVSVEQLDEIEGLPAEAKTFAIVAQPHPRQLAINRLTLNELRRHPYINFYQAKAIIEYRRLHGPLASLSELRLLSEFTPEAIARLEPYVSYE